MKLLPTLALCSALAVVYTGTETAPAPAAFPEKETHAPRPLPDRIVLT